MLLLMLAAIGVYDGGGADVVVLVVAFVLCAVAVFIFAVSFVVAFGPVGALLF